MTITEMQICTCWHFTKSTEGCRAFIDSMAELELSAQQRGDKEDYELIRSARDLAFCKGNILISEES